MPARRLLALSFLNIAAFQSLLFIAAQRLPGGIAAMVGALQPLMIVLLSWGIDKRRPHPSTLVAAGLGLAGMGAIFDSSAARFDPLGLVAALTGTASLAAATFLAPRWRRNLPLLPFIGWQLALGGLMLLGPAVIMEPELPPLSPAQWMGYAYLSLLGTVVAYILWFRGLALLAPVSVSALGMLSPVTAILLGWLILGEAFHTGQAVGIVVVLASAGVLQATASPGRPPALHRSRPTHGRGISTDP
jgi:probable blue pigment (indigoidine) exporter